VIVFKKYCIRVDRLFVFQCFSNVFKRGSCEVKRGSLGLAEKGRVGEKEEVVSKRACRFQAKELLVYFCNIV
jgi:hypothetical protein